MDVNLEGQEQVKFGVFKSAIEEIVGKPLGLSDFRFVLHPTAIGTVFEVQYDYEDDNGGKATFKRDITDYDLW